MPSEAESRQSSLTSRVLRNLRPSHQHGPIAATMLITAAQMLSRVVGLAREKYVSWAFGANGRTDAFFAAFTLPDYLYYIVAGGAASITFIAIYTRYLTEKREEEANHVFSTILTLMVVVLGALIVAGEIFAPQIVALILPGFRDHPAELRECIYLTRIILPMQLFFYVGGVVSAVLLSHRLFLAPAIAPIFYTLGIIGGGLLLSHQIGLASMAVGAVAGAFGGPFLVNALAARRTRIRYRPTFDLRDSGFREWVRLSIPLMLGVSLASADEWIMRAFASHDLGAISHLSYAKKLFNAPYAVIGLSVGVASMTFFARMFSEKRYDDFAARINDSVYRAMAASFLLSAWLWAVALPVTHFIYAADRFTPADVRSTASFFAIFSLSLVFWTAQTLYARAFYAARDTLTPMITATIITAASVVAFWALFRAFGVPGLAYGSNVGIAAQTVALAVLLDRKRRDGKKLVPLSGMNWRELGKALLVAAMAGASCITVQRYLGSAASRREDVVTLLWLSGVWAIVCWAGLRVMRSNLLDVLRQRA